MNRSGAENAEDERTETIISQMKYTFVSANSNLTPHANPILIHS